MSFHSENLHEDEQFICLSPKNFRIFYNILLFFIFLKIPGAGELGCRSEFHHFINISSVTFGVKPKLLILRTEYMNQKNIVQ